MALSSSIITVVFICFLISAVRWEMRGRYGTGKATAKIQGRSRSKKTQRRCRSWGHCWHLYCTIVDHWYGSMVCVCLPQSNHQIRTLPYWCKCLTAVWYLVRSQFWPEPQLWIESVLFVLLFYRSVYSFVVIIIFRLLSKIYMQV